MSRVNFRYIIVWGVALPYAFVTFISLPIELRFALIGSALLGATLLASFVFYLSMTAKEKPATQRELITDYFLMIAGGILLWFHAIGAIQTFSK